MTNWPYSGEEHKTWRKQNETKGNEKVFHLSFFGSIPKVCLWHRRRYSAFCTLCHCFILSEKIHCPAVSLYITMSKEIDCMSTLMSPSGHSDPWAISKNKALLISDPIHITSSAKRIRPRDGRIYFAMSQLQNNPIPTDKIQSFSISSLRTFAKTFVATTQTGKGSYEIFASTYKNDC